MLELSPRRAFWVADGLPTIPIVSCLFFQCREELKGITILVWGFVLLFLTDR